MSFYAKKKIPSRKVAAAAIVTVFSPMDEARNLSKFCFITLEIFVG